MSSPRTGPASSSHTGTWPTGAWFGSCNGNGGDQPILILGKYVLSGSQLFDWNLKAAFWNYSLNGQGARGSGSPDGRYWFATDAQGVAVLRVQTLPDDAALAFATQIASGNVKPIVTPGMPVQLQINGGNAKFRANAENAQKDWQARGYKIGPGGLTVNLSAVEQATGQVIAYNFRKVGAVGKGELDKINARKVVCTCTVTDPQGAVVAKNNAVYTYPGNMIFDGTASERQLSEAMWRAAESFGSFVALPTNQYRVGGQIETLPKFGQLKGGG